MNSITHGRGKLSAAVLGALSAAILLVGALPGPAAAASPSNLALYVPAVGGSCIYVTAPANKTLHLTWKDGSGAVKELASIPTGVGDPMYCAAKNVIAVGDRLKVSYGSHNHKLTIPVVTARVNRITDKILGTGPAGARLRIECGHYPFGQFEPCQWTKSVTVSSSGTWSAKVPFDMFGGWTMDVRWHNAYGDEVYYETTVPYFEVYLGKARFSGVTTPLDSATVTVADSTMTPKGSGSAASGPREGTFAGKLRDAGGHLVAVVPGDFVSSSVSKDASFLVPQISATATAADDHVWGQCELTDSYRSVYIELYRNGRLLGAADEGMTDGTFDFNFRHTFPRPVNVRAGDKILVNCIQGEGDRAVLVIFAS
jgi:hypothetical protein